MAFSSFWNWLRAIFKKWVWVLGLTPLLLDYVSSYIPEQYTPTSVANFLETGTTWQLSLVLFSIGLFVSIYLVHVDNEKRYESEYTSVKNRLKTYEHHAPEYLMEITDTDVGTCNSGCHVEIKCTIKIEPTNPWTGFLTKVFIRGKHQLMSLSDWEIERVSVNNNTLRDKPLEIKAPKVDLDVKIKSAINHKIELVEHEWNEVTIPINLLIEYMTNPVGQVEISKDLLINANLSRVYPSALKHQQIRSERMAEENTNIGK